MVGVHFSPPGTLQVFWSLLCLIVLKIALFQTGATARCVYFMGVNRVWKFMEILLSERFSRPAKRDVCAQ